MTELEYGPWLSVPKERQLVCAFKRCHQEGKPQVCFADGRYHHHGCIHYNRNDSKFRTGGWCWLCDEHYKLLENEWKIRNSSPPPPEDQPAIKAALKFMRGGLR